MRRPRINAPVITLWPSHKPFLLPTQTPSQKPSQTPSLLPSQKPSPKPSSNPTPKPTSNPTPIPSSAPTDYIPCNKNCPVKPNICGFYETCGNGCWCGRFPPTPSSLPTLTPTQNLFEIGTPTMIPYNGAVSILLSPMPTLQPSSKSTHSPTTLLPSTISPSTLHPTITPSESPILPPVQSPTPLPTLFPSPLPSSDQKNSILSSNGASNNSSASSNTIIASAVVGSVILLLIAIVIVFCFVRKNKKLDAFTKWRMHYDVQTPMRRDTPATIETDIHHFYKKNPSTHNRDFTPYVSKSQRGSQRNSLKPQPMNLPMTEYNRHSLRL